MTENSNKCDVNFSACEDDEEKIVSFFVTSWIKTKELFIVVQDEKINRHSSDCSNSRFITDGDHMVSP